MSIKDVDMNKVTPMMRQYIEVKEKNPDIIIFFRLGDFYEMFFDDAINVSRELELTLTGKNAGLDEKIPMCGIPHHAANIYIDKLIDLGYKVGICEQLEDPKTVLKGIVKRDLTQIISKGMVFDGDTLDEKDFNYIGSVIDYDHAYVISYADITTGSIYVEILEHSKTKLVSEIVSIGIKEIIVTDSFDKSITNLLNNQFKITITISNDIEEINEYKYIYSNIEDSRLTNSLKHLLAYINITQKRLLTHLKEAKKISFNEYLKMDIHTKRNLELTETLRLKQRNYSLIWLLDKTKTAMGSRMLKNYIENPLIDRKTIEARYDVVETLLKEFILKEELQNYLFEVYDLERLSGRIAFGSANARDLLQLKSSIKVLPGINKVLKEIGYKEIETLPELYDLLEESIYDNPPITLKEGYLIK